MAHAYVSLLPSVSESVGAEEDLWNVKRAAKFLAMSTHWIYKAVAEGTVPYRKIGSAIRFVPAELRAWVAAQGGER
jgi:excisionase family DNA binding protein